MKWIAYIVGSGLVALLAAVIVANHYRFGETDSVTGLNSAQIVERSLTRSQMLRKEPVFGSLTSGEQELFDSGRVLPQSHRYRRDEMKALLQFAATCRQRDRLDSKNPGMRKAMIYTSAVCGVGDFDSTFWQSAPFVHPMGRSYVARAVDDFEKFDRAWAETKARYMHVSETMEWFPEKGAGDLSYRSLDRAERREWVQLKRLIVRDFEVWHLFQEQSKEGPPVARYQVFLREDLQAELSAFGLRLSPDGTECIGQGAEICLAVDEFGAKVRIWSTWAINGSGGVVVFGGLLLVGGWWRGRRRYVRDRAMVLQTLAHELRTPVTSMGLSVELLRKEVGDLSAAGQEAFFRLANDSVRLKRLVEKSREYLTVSASDAGEPVDLNTIVGDVCSEFGLEFEHRFDSAVAVSNSFWLAVGLRNLIENAYEHGKPPVVVRVDRENGYQSITIVDQGDLSVSEFRRVRRDFTKGQSSRGTGLGLGIAIGAMTKLGHSFEFAPNPTTFTIRIKGADGQSE